MKITIEIPESVMSELSARLDSRMGTSKGKSKPLRSYEPGAPFRDDIVRLFQDRLKAAAVSAVKECQLEIDKIAELDAYGISVEEK